VAWHPSAAIEITSRLLEGGVFRSPWLTLASSKVGNSRVAAVSAACARADLPHPMMTGPSITSARSEHRVDLPHGHAVGAQRVMRYRSWFFSRTGLRSV
jgi:hypothetical protein